MTERKAAYQICAEYLGVSPQDVLRAADKAPTSYKRYSVRKRSRKGWRTIHHPSRPTKAIQHALLETLVTRMRVSDCAMAYRPGIRSPLLRNAQSHAPFRFSVRVDVRDYFPSIGPDDCFGLFEQADVLGRPLDDRERAFIASAAFVRSDMRLALAIGAPISPSLSNAVMYELDLGFSGFAESKDGVYTRYADDLIFSSNGKGDCADFVEFVTRGLREIESPSLRVNREKTRFMSRGTRRPITGLIVTPDGKTSLGRHRKRLIRSMLHRYSLYLHWEHKYAKEDREHLAGLLAFVLDVEPDFYNRMALKYSAQVVNAALGARKRRRGG